MKHGPVPAAGAAAVIAALAHTANAAPSPDKPAASMNDLRDHFAGCFQPPQEAAGSRVTFYFSLNTRGQVLGPPRTTWIGFKGADDEKIRGLAGFRDGFSKCLPLSMTEPLAASIPGKVYFLQYVVADTGRTSQVLLRPFGSHYYDDGYQAPLDRTPLVQQPPVAPVFGPRPAWRGRPPIRLVRPIVPRVPIIVPRPNFAPRPRVVPRPGLAPRVR